MPICRSASQNTRSPPPIHPPPPLPPPPSHTPTHPPTPHPTHTRTPAGDVVLKETWEKCIKPDRHYGGKEVGEGDVLELQRGGTGFAEHDKDHLQVGAGPLLGLGWERRIQGRGWRVFRAASGAPSVPCFWADGGFVSAWADVRALDLIGWAAEQRERAAAPRHTLAVSIVSIC